MAIQQLEMDLEFMETIGRSPQEAQQLYAQACSSDRVTVDTWRAQWIGQAKANHAKYGPFSKNHIGKFFGKYARQPMIVAGSGPSLKKNVEQLKDTKGIQIVSCLHNFHFMVDHGIKNAYFVTLDAGAVTIEEVWEGGKKTPDEYWAASKDYTLLAYISTHPDLLEKWQGEIVFYNCPVPAEDIVREYDKLEEFNAYVSTGGNVLGACVYIAKAVMGANPIIFVGADFCFSYTKKFHAWDSKYDGNIGQALRCVDVYGNKALTWQSYYNFKTFFDWMAQTVGGIYINATEGGIFGAYPEGNIKQVVQMELKSVLRMYSQHEDLRAQFENPSEHRADKLILY